ncbi:hypothetical protein JG687_00003386 [Phytophthora cactorum]|uniref:Uncharacterized protein n=1 Tax=Phytophthora cactorum TaxID=29920 RepID=A0A8T1UUM3_9STRA|nr:hypothetical protein JG687_00003386 [Phytophthora cactorum]
MTDRINRLGPSTLWKRGGGCIYTVRQCMDFRRSCSSFKTACIVQDLTSARGYWCTDGLAPSSRNAVECRPTPTPTQGWAGSMLGLNASIAAANAGACCARASDYASHRASYSCCYSKFNVVLSRAGTARPFSTGSCVLKLPATPTGTAAKFAVTMWSNFRSDSQQE